MSNREREREEGLDRIMGSPLYHEAVLSGTRTAIRFLVMLGVIWCVGLWVVLPTSMYKQTLQPSIRAKTNNIYFGRQGANLLIWAFPVLSVAVLGCIYLHVGKQLNQNYDQSEDKRDKGEKGRRHRSTIWQRPALLQGPLGIVTVTELAFFLMFVALLTWSLYSYLHVGFSQINAKRAAKFGMKVWQTKLDSAALRLGLVGNICLSFLFFPVSRGSPVLPLFGMTSEASIKYHIWVGHLAMAFFTAHGLCYIILWASTHELQEMLRWPNTGISNVAGEISLLAGLVMWATTFSNIRRKMFELFFYTHYLYIVFMLFFIYHVGFSYSCIMLPNFYLFVVDRFLRFLQSNQKVRLASARVLPGDTLELNFSKNPALEYGPASIMFICLPSLSKLQWHPFTITSSSNFDSKVISVVIKGHGSWSKKLYEMLSSPSPPTRLEVSVEGPYGPVSSHYLKHDMVVMVSGGSGITSFVSIIRELIFASGMLKLRTPKVLLISAFKNTAELSMLDLLIPLDGSPCEVSSLQIQIEAYVTRERQRPSMETPKGSVIWFKPDATDLPVSATLGPNSWLLLGAIISSSFVIFIIIMVLINGFYIKTSKSYPSVASASIYCLFMCICIGGVATAAFLWNKKRNDKGMMQIINMEVSSPHNNIGAELESLPLHTLLQANTKVHYGQRPDLKSVLGGCKGSNIEVLVSGPSQLRQRVASICSSSVGSHLNFESVSFDW